MPTITRQTLSCLPGLLLLLFAIALTVCTETQANGLTVVLPDGRHIAAKRLGYEVGARRVVVIERPIFVDGGE